MEAIIAFQLVLIIGLFALLLVCMSKQKALQEHFNSFLEYFKVMQRHEADLSLHLFERIRAVETKQRNSEVTWQ